MMTLQEFLEQDTQNAWVKFEELEIYLRRGYHAVAPGKAVDTLDVANAENYVQRGTGSLWRALDLITPVAQRENRVVYFENVLNEQLAESLTKRGWTELKTHGWPSSFVMAQIETTVKPLTQGDVGSPASPSP